MVASAFKSFTFKLHMVTSIFHNIFVQDCRIPGFNSVYQYETGAYLVSYQYLNSIYNFAVHFSIVFHPHIGQQAATMIVQLEKIYNF